MQTKSSKMSIKPIKNDTDYYAALARLEAIFDEPVDSPKGDEAEILTILIEHFEDEHFPIEAPDPIEAIKIRMEELNYQQKDLVGIIGGKSRVSEILNRKRKLTIEMIRRLTEVLSLPPEVLIKDYQIAQ